MGNRRGSAIIMAGIALCGALSRVNKSTGRYARASAWPWGTRPTLSIEMVDLLLVPLLLFLPVKKKILRN
jgi:hypothetical protein